MAKLPLPQRGQPLDVSYIYSIADAVNDLSSQVSSSTYNYTTVDTISAGTQNIKTSECRVVAGYKEVTNNTTVNPTNEIPFTYDFTRFKFAPIVTATPINIGDTPSGRDVSVVLKLVTNSRVEGIIKLSSPGNVTIGINLIMVGIPGQ
jgi:hypothetical protein